MKIYKQVLGELIENWDGYPFSDKIEAVLFHIWARSAINAPSNLYRKRYFLVLLYIPFDPLIKLLVAVMVFINPNTRKRAHFLRPIFESILSIPLDFSVAMFEFITDGVISKSIAKKHVSKREHIDLNTLSSRLANFVTTNGIAIMQEPFTSEADRISEMQRNSSHQQQEQLMKLVSEYWAKN